MTQYAVTWHPYTDNLGDDLLTLAASCLLPRVDRVLNADHLDEPFDDLEPNDRIVTLMCGDVMRHPVHWPPERHIAPAITGAHFSHEDIWGVPFSEIGETGLKYLAACGTIGCRDQRTVELMESMGLPCQLTACLTLTLKKPEVSAPARPYMVMCDVPEDVQRALKEHVNGLDFRTVTHLMTENDQDYETRMHAAHDMLKLYAAAQCVVTRRLHCAMACLAIGTPVLLLYHADYEDVTRFAPMNGMLQTETMEKFLTRVRAGRFIPRWKNPDDVQQWKDILIRSVQEAVARAETIPLPILRPEEATAWRQARTTRMAASAARKIHRLESERYEQLHEKFSLVLREDAAKSALTTLLAEPEVRRGLENAALRRCLSTVKWYKRPLLWWKIRQGKAETEDLYKLALDVLAPLGWPDSHLPEA